MILAAAAPVCHWTGIPPDEMNGLESSIWYMVIVFFCATPGLYNGLGKPENFLMIPGVVFQIVAQVFSALASIVGASVGIDCLGVLYGAYKRAAMRLDDEKWLRENCRDPVFFSKMRAHTRVCSEVEANARVGAFWTALHEVTDVMRVTWQPWAMGWAGFIVLALLLAICICAPGRRGVYGRARSLPVMQQQGMGCKDVFA